MNFKIFCDESNHLESDSSNLMVLGAIQCPEEEVVKANKTINPNYAIEITNLTFIISIA